MKDPDLSATEVLEMIVRMKRCTCDQCSEVPRDAQWKDVKEIDKDVQGPFGLVWGKDEHGTVAQLFYFKKFPHWYYANQADLAGGVTHYIFIGE